MSTAPDEDEVVYEGRPAEMGRLNGGPSGAARVGKVLSIVAKTGVALVAALFLWAFFMAFYGG